MITQPFDVGQQADFNLYNVDWPGSPFAAASGALVTNMLSAPYIEMVSNSYDETMNNVQYLLSLPKVACDDVRDVWMEEPDIDLPVVVRAAAAAVTNTGTGTVQQTIPITDESLAGLALQHCLLYPRITGQPVTEATVVAIDTTPGAATVTVRSYNGMSLPALSEGQKLGNGGPRYGDGEPAPKGSYLPVNVQFWNGMVQIGTMAVRWDPMDSKRWPDHVKAAAVRNLRKKFYNAVGRAILLSNGGTQGLTTLADGRQSFSMKGLIPQAERAGVGVNTVTASGFRAMLRSAIHALQVEEDTNEWLLLGPGEILDAVGDAETSDRIRYKVGDREIDSRVTAYRFWGHTVTPIRLNVMRKEGVYGDGYGNRAILVRRNQIKLTYWKKWPMFKQDIRFSPHPDRGSVDLYANLEGVAMQGFFGFRLEKAWSIAMFDVLV